MCGDTSERVFRAQLLAPLGSHLVRQQPAFSTTQVPIPKVSRVGWDFQVILLKHPEFGVQHHTESALPCINAHLLRTQTPLPTEPVGDGGPTSSPNSLQVKASWI